MRKTKVNSIWPLLAQHTLYVISSCIIIIILVDMSLLTLWLRCLYRDDHRSQCCSNCGAKEERQSQPPVLMLVNLMNHLNLLHQSLNHLCSRGPSQPSRWHQICPAIWISSKGHQSPLENIQVLMPSVRPATQCSIWPTAAPVSDPILSCNCGRPGKTRGSLSQPASGTGRRLEE